MQPQAVATRPAASPHGTVPSTALTSVTPAAQPSKPVLLLIDGLNIVRRVYEAVPGDDSPAKADGAMASSWGSILRAIAETGPTHFLAAFDAGGPTWRHELYPQYKCGRKPMPQPLRDALPGLLARLNAAGLRTLTAPGVEADDTLSTLATKAIRRGFDVVVASTDKDMCRLIHDGVRVRDHFNSEWRDEAYVHAKYGIPSRLMGDLLALMGDETDGIPGIEGIGPKTAAKLLNEHGSLAGVLEAAFSDVAPIKGAVGDKLRNQADLARMSFRLAAMRLDVPLGLSPNDIMLPPSVAVLVEEREAALARSRARAKGKVAPGAASTPVPGVKAIAGGSVPTPAKAPTPVPLEAVVAASAETSAPSTARRMRM